MDIERFARAGLSVCQSQFPRSCRACGTTFPSFSAYLQLTTAIGHPMLDPIDDDDPIGVLCFANCACGSTLALRYEDTREHRAFNDAVHEHAVTSGVRDIDVLVELVQTMHRWAQEGAPVTLPAGSSAPPVPVTDPVLLEMGAALVAIIGRGTLTIPPAPTAALKVRALASADDVNARAVADALAVDPGLATGVLRVANSASFSRSGEVSSLLQAVTRLGFQEVAQLSLTLGIGRAFLGGGPFAIERALQWRRSMLTAMLARVLASSRRLDAEECFGAGLFSSLGSVVGLLALESLVQERSELAAQPWDWWMHLVEMVAADCGREVARRWELPSLLAAVVSHPHIDGVPPYEYRDVVGAVAAAREVATRAMETPHLARADLANLGALRTDDERDRLVNALPGFVAAIAAIDGGLVRAPATTSREPEPVPSPARPLVANTLVPSVGRFDVVGLVSDALVLEGPVTFAPTTLVSVALEVEPPLRVWATVTHTAPSSDGGHRVYLMPFALDEISHRRWRLLLADQAAERTRQTLRKMESPKKP